MINKLYIPLGRLLALISLILFPLLSSQAQTIRYVKTSPVGTGDGTSWANATSDLQAAINSLTATGGQVWVASGLYKPTVSTDPDSRTISFAMKSKVAIYGGFSGSENTLSERQPSRPSSTTLSGNIGNESLDTDNSYHVLTSIGVDSTGLLDGFIITAGNANGNDTYSYGGGMYFVKSSAHLNNCFFLTNSGRYGGAIGMNSVGNEQGSTESFYPQITNCSFQNNSAVQGGGILIGGNYTNTTLVMTNCSFLGNSGKVITIGSFRVTHELNLINCSFQSNLDGAIYMDGRLAGLSAQLTNCVLFNNGGSNTFYIRQGRIDAHYCLFDKSVTGYNFYNSDSTNQTTSSSPFVSSTSTQLAPCSAAIDAGDPASTTATGGSTDLAGNPRFIRTRIDQGAYEFQGDFCPSQMYTLRSGRWDDAAIWSMGRLPTSSEAVHLRHSVTIPAGYVANAQQLIYEQAIAVIYETDSRLQLGQ